MTIDSASQTIWNYMLMHHDLKKSDAILVLGNSDVRVARHAAQLYLDGWAPILICAGSGSIHNHKIGRERFINTTEAEVFSQIAIEMGVPANKIIIENRSQSTGQNYEFTVQRLKELNIICNRIIIVQKPYMERRSYATGKVWLPNVELIISSPSIPFDEYPNEVMDKKKVINTLVGDIQRIKEYPKKGFQIEQEIPEDVWNAYEYLVKEGFTERLIED